MPSAPMLHLHGILQLQTEVGPFPAPPLGPRCAKASVAGNYTKQPIAQQTIPSPQWPSLATPMPGFPSFSFSPFSPALPSLFGFPLLPFFPLLFMPETSQLSPSPAHPSSSGSQPNMRLFLGRYFNNCKLFIKMFLPNAPRTLLDINLVEYNFLHLITTGSKVL